MYRIRKSWNDEKSQIGAYENLSNAKSACKSGYKVFDDNGNVTYDPNIISNKEGFQASSLNELSNIDKIKKIAPLYQDCMKKTGMLASVGLAQFILESGYGTSNLAQYANNLHGMKCMLSGNTWEGSTWDGESKFTKYSGEVYDGKTQNVKSEFRSYKCCEDSITDRAAYLIGAKNGSVLRYPNINKIKDAEEQIKLIKSGGYATSPTYVEKLMKLVNEYNLTQYDEIEINLYRVRKDWSDTKSQKGAFEDLENAKNLAESLDGYNVYDSDGKLVYSPKKKLHLPIKVKITMLDLNIRKEPTTDSEIVKTIEPGVFTITEIKQGNGSDTGWGRLKSNIGWISLDFVTILD